MYTHETCSRDSSSCLKIMNTLIASWNNNSSENPLCWAKHACLTIWDLWKMCLSRQASMKKKKTWRRHIACHPRQWICPGEGRRASNAPQMIWRCETWSFRRRYISTSESNVMWNVNFAIVQSNSLYSLHSHALLCSQEVRCKSGRTDQIVDRTVC